MTFVDTTKAFSCSSEKEADLRFKAQNLLCTSEPISVSVCR